MLKAIRKRMDREEGFTLIELMVVVLIIAILIAIAIPTFLGARKRANDRAAQSNLRNALTAEKTYFTDAQVYTSVGTQLSSVEGSLVWRTGAVVATANPGDVYVEAPSASVVCVSVKSASGSYFGIRDDASGTGGSTYFTGAAVPAACSSSASAPYTLTAF